MKIKVSQQIFILILVAIMTVSLAFIGFLKILFPEYYVNWIDRRLDSEFEEILITLEDDFDINYIYDKRASLYSEYNAFLLVGDEETDIYYNKPSVLTSPRRVMNKATFMKDNQETKITIVKPLHRFDLFLRVLESFFIILLVLSFLAAVIVAFISSKALSRPLVKLHKKAQQMSRLDFKNPIVFKKKNEFYDIGLALNQLAVNLDVSNNQLKEELALKEKQEQVRIDFVANASHELKTPLSVMKCYVEMIRDGVDQDSITDQYKIILDEIKKMNRLLSQMMDLSKVESGAISINKDVISLEKLIEDMVYLFEPSALESDLKIEIKGQIRPVLGDYMRIEQVLFNLISNSVKYADKNTLVIIKGSIEEGLQRISVTNTCQSMTQEIANESWSRFYQGDQSHHDKGSGLGLSIVSALLKLHQSNFGVDVNQPRITYWFELPISEG